MTSTLTIPETSGIRKMNKQYALDTMCFIYLFEANQVYFNKVEKLFKQIEQNKIQASTSIISLIEVLSSPAIENNLQLKAKYQNFFYTMPNLKLVDVSHEQAKTAATLRRKYKIRTPDAIQLATAITQKADYFITNDKQLKKINEIEIKLIQESLQ